jgi:hypothetical protein
MAETRATNPLVEQFQLGGVPQDLRLMAAQGLLPLKPEDVAELLLLLVRDSDPQVAEAASHSLQAFPASELLPILKDKATLPGILGWCLTHREERDLREAALQNTSTPDKAIEGLAATLSSELAELVVINQVRLLRRTSLLEALEANTGLNNDQKRRLRELRETFRIGEVEAPPDHPEPEPALPTAPALGLPPERPLSEAEAVAHYLSESEEEKKDGDKISAVQKIYRLNTAEKVITALKGSREERAVLIRDNNRLVSTAVLGSPRISEPEIEAFAAMKSLSDEILRQIGTNREWTRRYGVIVNLVKNPRTPVAVSIGMVARLTPRDIKAVSMDRNVPEVIRKQALRFVKTTGKGA